MKINKAKLRQIINEEVASLIGEKKDKVSKKISYLMDKEGEDHDRAVAIALSMKDRGELEEGFKSGEKVTHDEYGDGVVTHPGTKNTDVAVKFKKDTGRGKNVKVSRGSLKKAVKEVIAAVTEAAGPYPSREAMEEFEKSGGRDADETVLAWLRSLPSEQMDFLRKLSVSEATDAIMALYQIDRRFEQRDGETSVPYNAARILKFLGAPDSFLKEEEDAMRGAVRPGAGIEDIPQPEDEETVDRAFDSPEGRLLTLIRAREALGNMTRAQLEDLATDLDASMAATLRHILSNRMYDPMEEADEMELEEGATEYNNLLRQGYSQATALAMASGTAEQKAKYDQLTDRRRKPRPLGDSEARRFVYGRSYSAMGQR